MLPYFDNQEYLKEKNILTIEDIFLFLDWMRNQEISNTKEAWYCRFWESCEIPRSGFERFFIIGKMIRDHFLIADMKDYICTMREEPKELKEFMETTLMKKWFILKWLKKEYNTIDIFSEKFGFNYFMSLVDAGDDFNMQIRTSPFFIDFFISFISKSPNFPDFDEKIVNQNLFLDINSYLQNKRNFNEEIILKYNIEVYAKEKKNIWSILKNLEEKWYLRIKNILIKEFYITFILDSFCDFSKELFWIEETEVTTESIKQEKIGITFDEDTGKTSINWEEIYLKIGKNDYKFFQILYQKYWKSVSYEEIKKHVNNGKVSSSDQEYCQKIKCDLPEIIKKHIIATWEGYRIDT